MTRKQRLSVGVLSALGAGGLLGGALLASYLVLATAGGGSATVAATPTDSALSLLKTLMGGGFASSVLAIVTWIWGRLRGSTTAIPNLSIPDDILSNMPEMIEAAQAFAVFMADRDSRAAQRRLVFALVDLADGQHIRGLSIENEGGTIVLRYSGFAEPLLQQMPVSRRPNAPHR